MRMMMMKKRTTTATTTTSGSGTTPTSNTTCFPITSLPPRPKSSNSSHGGSSSTTRPYGSPGMRDKLYYANMEEERSKRRTMSSKSHGDKPPGVATIGQHHHHQQQHRSLNRSTSAGGGVPYNNNNNSAYKNKNQDLYSERDERLGRGRSSSSIHTKSINYNEDGGRCSSSSSSDSDSDSLADRDRIIHEMLYGKPREDSDNEQEMRSSSSSGRVNRCSSPFGFVYGGHYRADPSSSNNSNGGERGSASNGSTTPKTSSKRFSFLMNGLKKLDRKRSGSTSSLPGNWLWQKSLSDGNLYPGRKKKDYYYYEDEWKGQAAEERENNNNYYYYHHHKDEEKDDFSRGTRSRTSQQEQDGEEGEMRGRRIIGPRDTLPPPPPSHQHAKKNRKEWEKNKKKKEQQQQQQQSSSSSVFENTRHQQHPLMSRTWARNSVCTSSGSSSSSSSYNNGSATYNNTDPLDSYWNNDMFSSSEGMAMKQKSVPKFFRSISLRNLLPIGGMNKSRTGPTQGKRVSPPTVPGLVSFSSFRVKKSQQQPSGIGHCSGSDQQLSSPCLESGVEQQQQQQQQRTNHLQHHHHHHHLHHHHLNGGPNHSNNNNNSVDTTQRHSGSSLGSAGSSYASSASSSDNRSSIGTDGTDLTDVEEGVFYHPASQQIHVLKSSRSADSFSSSSVSSSTSTFKQHQHQTLPPPPHPTACSSSLPPATHHIVDMHQGFYGKVGGISNGSNSDGSSSSISATSNGTLVTVHVDPHSVSANVQHHHHPHHPPPPSSGAGVSSAGALSTSTSSSSSSSVSASPASALATGPSSGGPGNNSLVAAHSNNSSQQAHHQHQHPHQHHHHTVQHHHPTAHHHQQHHPHHQHAQQHAVNLSTPNAALSMTNAYQTQISLDDQGIDMTQSPGRESPSSTASSNTGSGSSSAIGSVGSGSNGCRHSTASFDSGRASSTIYQQGVRYSGLSSESSSGSFRHSYHSSSSSLGSIAPEEICNFDVAAMIAQGIPDHEVLNAWLTGIHFETYYQNFIQAGYDMHTISRMTPEDLNAIGVTKPHHRKRLKSEISQLNISDGLPDYIPGSIEEWLSLLKLDEYTAKLHGQGYHSVRQVTNITWEDLEDLGVLRLGHQKKFMLAIKRIEDILAGKRIPTSSSQNAYLTPMDSFPRRAVPNVSNMSGMSMASYSSMNGVSQQQHHHQFHPIYSNSRGSGLSQTQQHQTQQQQQPQMWRQNSHNASSGVYAHLPPHTLTHQPQLHHVSNSVNNSGGGGGGAAGSAAAATPSPVSSQYYPDVISIQVKNGRRKSVENMSAQEPIYGTSSFLPSQAQSKMTLGNIRSSGNSVKFEEGDITPTNETVSGGGSTILSTSTLPRLLKNKPIAKIMGGGSGGVGGGGMRNSVNPVPERCPSPSGGFQQTPSSSASSSQQILTQYPYADGYKSLPRDIGRMSKAGLNLYSAGNYAGATKTLGKTNSFKSGPPPPPRRGSCSGSEKGSTIYATGQLVLGSYNEGNGNPMSSNNMPPPPPNLSCDQFSCSNAQSRMLDEFPPPPHPDDLAMSAAHSMTSGPLPGGGGGGAAAAATTRQQNKAPNAVATSVNNASPNNITLKMNTPSNPAVHHNSNNNSNHNSMSSGSNHHSTVRTSPPNSSTKSREPSPVGSDFSDSDLPPGGLLSRGVRRNGSDASFKSNSSTESESIPFANDNAGTIKQQKPGSRAQQLVTASAASTASPNSNQGSGDVLNDIGNMLADLTDELDAILEQEMNSKR